MTYLSKSELALVLTVIVGTAPAPAQAGVPQFGSNRALQSPAASNAVVIPPAPASPIPINALPFQANATGYYRLTQDLTVVAGQDGITVLDDDVVIDLNGFAIDGGLTGIRSSVRTTILNGTIFGFSEDGISPGVESTVVRVESVQNGRHGMDLGPGSVVQECKVVGNGGDGIRGDDLTVLQCKVLSNGESGIRTEQFGLVVIGSEVASNTGRGIFAFDPIDPGTNPCTIENCRVSKNNVGLQLSSFSQVRQCVVSDNALDGIQVRDFSYVGQCFALRNATGIVAATGSRVEGCTVSSNTTGIESASGVFIMDCVAFDNGEGITGATRSTVQNCNVIRNTTGITFTGAENLVEGCTVNFNELIAISVVRDSVVANNRVTENQGQGIRALGDANRIDGNHATRNGIGIDVQGARNLIVRNSLDTNGVQMQIAADNVQGPFLKTTGFVQSDNPWANFDLSFPATFP